MTATLACQSHTPPPYYHHVAEHSAVPVRILYAVALAESGTAREGRYHPWPWTLNIEGIGHYYDSFQDAAVALHEALGADKSVDIGLMQINAHWHGHRVRLIDHLLLPKINVWTGAAILREQQSGRGDWWEAVGRYHAPGNDAESRQRAERYRQRVFLLYLRYQQGQGREAH